MTPATVNAGYYGGHHYKYGYGHYYPHYRHHYGYGYHHRYHRGYHSHYGVSAHVGGDAAYVVLGLLGAALLYHVFSNNRYDNKKYDRVYPRKKPVVLKTPSYKKQTVVTSNSRTIRNYHYKDSEGWDWLAKGNSGYAIDIFAIQSQQNLYSGVPKIGFAIAAANNGEIERSIRAMRRAIRTDPESLNKLPISHEHRFAIREFPIKDKLITNKENDDNAFMLAVLSYLQQDYIVANSYITDADHSQSTTNLRRLINSRIN
ncbi:MAG: hypothetical protein MI865_06150 [Proteobacteria bacterium]|nr:hypothetical protein [Pseudomonadota bacterium]